MIRTVLVEFNEYDYFNVKIPDEIAANMSDEDINRVCRRAAANAFAEMWADSYIIAKYTAESVFDTEDTLPNEEAHSVNAVAMDFVSIV